MFHNASVGQILQHYAAVLENIDTKLHVLTKTMLPPLVTTAKKMPA